MKKLLSIVIGLAVLGLPVMAATGTYCNGSVVFGQMDAAKMIHPDLGFHQGAILVVHLFPFGSCLPQLSLPLSQ